MVTHHRDQHFFGKFEKLRVEAAGDGSGEFGEVDQSFEQRGVGLDARGGEMIPNARAALFGGEDDVMIAQTLFVVGSGDDDFARAQAAMAGGQIAGADAGYFERNGLFAQQSEQPADGTDEARTVLGGPVHGLGKVDSEHDARAGLRPGCRWCGGLPPFSKRRKYSPLGVDSTTMSSGLMPCLRAKPATACAGADLAGPRMRSSESARRSGRPSTRSTRRRGRGIEADGFMREFELLEKQEKIFERGGNHPIGDLFGTDFEQERQAHWAASAMATLADPPRLGLRRRPVCARAG